MSGTTNGRRQAAGAGTTVLTPQQFMKDLKDVFDKAGRTVTSAQLYAMTLLASEDEFGPAILHVSNEAAVEDVARNVGRYTQTAFITKDPKFLPTERMLAAIAWMIRPLTEGQDSFIVRHAEWMQASGINVPSTRIGYMRVYTKHAREYGTGENNTCEICQVQMEQRDEERAKLTAFSDQQVARFRQTLKIEI